MFRSKFLFTSAAAGLVMFRNSNVAYNSAKAPEDKNSAFVFIKPHANTAKAQDMVKSKLKAKGLTITAEGELTGEQIDKGMLIDQHYYAIASKATLLKPKDLPVPAKKFEEFFGKSWEDALKEGSVYNALDACKYLGVDADQLDKLWAKAKKVKFGGGFYCGIVEGVPGKKPIYVFNAFFMSMRSKFVQPGTSIHYYVVDFPSNQLHWSDFRGKVLGPTDPKDAPADSIRGGILADWKKLGLEYEPNVGDNGVHASASPFEGLAEKMNWLKIEPTKDEFGSRLISAGVSVDTIKNWSVDPQVKGKSIFDQLEDLDAGDCIKKAVSLAK
jgi:nucleoside diphosphate kinase